MIYALRVHSKINFNIDLYVQSNLRFLPKKNNTDTESLGLDYNKLNSHKHANKTRR